MVSVASFSPGNPSSNLDWFTVSNSNQNLSVTNNASMLYSSKLRKPAMGVILVGIDKYLSGSIM